MPPNTLVNQNVTHGGYATFSCAGGYRLEGLKNLRCLWSEWTGEIPTCVIAKGNRYIANFRYSEVIVNFVKSGVKSLLQWNLVRTNTGEMRSPYPEFELTGVICFEKALKGTEIVFVLTGISY